VGKRQLRIAGTGGAAIKEIDRAAEAYVSVRDERMGLTKKEVEARDALMAAMDKYKKTEYRDDDAVPPLYVEITEGETKVKVSKVKDGAEEGGGEGEE